MSVWILVIFLGLYSEGGVAIEQIEFQTEDDCRVAAKLIGESTPHLWESSRLGGYRMGPWTGTQTFCLKKYQA